MKDRPDPRSRLARGQTTLRPGRSEGPAAQLSSAPPPDSMGDGAPVEAPVASTQDPFAATMVATSTRSAQRSDDKLGATRPTVVRPREQENSSSGARARRSDTWPPAATDGSWESGPLESRDTAAADPLIGLVIADRYRILEAIGRGGMGIVYRVEHVRIGKWLAMKLLAGELSSNKEVVRRFKQEALTASKLSCPFTVQVFDYGVWQHLTFLVMELVEGSDLGRVLRRSGPIPFPRLGRLLVQVCASLSEAHQKGIVHRDIKPENVMLVADDAGAERAKVVDFGLAKLREAPDLNDVTTQGAVVGTPYYMSPEQILGEDVDGRTDIYALGAVMYRTLTGSYPFTATTPIAMFSKHLNEAPPEIAKAHPELDIPKAVSDAVRRCLAKKKEERFDSVEELRDVLLAELDKAGEPDPRGARLEPLDADRPPRKRGNDADIATREELDAYEATLRRNRYGLGLLLALFAVAATSSAGWALFRPTPPPRGLELEPNDNSGTANKLDFGSAIRGTIGRRLEERTGDQDVFRVTVPPATPAVALHLDPLPTFGLCASIHRVGYEGSAAHYCTGPAGAQPLDVPGLRLEAGDYFVVVRQDRTPAPAVGFAVPVHENISDHYRLTVGPNDGATKDLEPNDVAASAILLKPGEDMTGSLGFTDDVDVVCALGPGVRFVVEDGSRRAGTVLEATPLSGETPLSLARVHGSRAEPHATRLRMLADVNGPWRSPDCVATRCCVELRLTRDPWSEAGAIGPLADETHYRVTVERRSEPSTP